MASPGQLTIAEGQEAGRPTTSPPPEEDVNTAGAEGVGSGSLVTFKLAELLVYTGNFGDQKASGRGRNVLFKGCITGRHDPLDGTEIAVKVLSPNDEPTKEEWLREVDHLPRFANHPNIITLLGKCETTTRLFLVYPWMEKGDVAANMSDLDWGRAVKILMGTAKALQVMHSQNPPLIYRDLKPQNVLLDDSWNPLLCDFGLVGPRGAPIFGGTRLQAELEVFQGQADKATDIYSFGVFLFQVVMKSPRAIKYGLPVTDLARELDRSNRSAVDKDLLDTGCSDEMAERITSIGVACLDKKIMPSHQLSGISPTAFRATIETVIEVLSEIESEIRVQETQEQEEETQVQETQVQVQQEIEVQQETQVMQQQEELAAASSSKKGGLFACLSCFKTDAQ